MKAATPGVTPGRGPAAGGAVSRVGGSNLPFPRPGLVTRVAQVVVYRRSQEIAGNRPPSQLCWVNVWDGSRTGSGLPSTLAPALSYASGSSNRYQEEIRPSRTPSSMATLEVSPTFPLCFQTYWSSAWTSTPLGVSAISIGT